MTDPLPSPLTYRAVTYRHNATPPEVTTVSVDIFDTKRTSTALPLKDDSTMLIEVHAAALNPVDIVLMTATPRIAGAWRKGVGRDFSGRVVRAGARVTAERGFRAGDSVMGMYALPLGNGTVAEYLHMNPFWHGSVTKFDPAKLSYEQAAAWPLAGGTAYMSVFDHVRIDGWTPAGGSHPDRAVLVLGAGTAVGRFVVQIARAVLGVGAVVAVCSGASAAELRELGATHTVDYTAVKPGQSYASDVRALGFKYDLIVDCVGGYDILSSPAAGTTIYDFIKPKAEGSAYVTLIGDAKGVYRSRPALVNVSWCKLRQLASRVGLVGYTYALILTEPRRDWAQAFGEWLEAGKIRVDIDSVRDMAEIQAAIDHLATNRARGKVVLRVRK
ncbi:uncharacterized protein V1510DRAFT_414067 [Dipodascopsis tothii]|uniref:uncharacterized protein n=1 Tax=Dipodascopsis tothii TaxID=44089 RepID=UPI0034CF1B1E